MSKEIIISYNPHSGKGNGRKRADKLQKRLEKLGVSNTRVFGTNSIDVVYEFCNSEDIVFDSIHCIIILGGDGTLSYWVDALIKSGKNNIPIYPLGLGTANDVASYFKTGKSVKRAAKKLSGVLDTKEITIDVLWVNNERYAIYVAGSGAFTNGVGGYSKTAKKIFGKFAYIIKAFFGAFTMKVQNIDFEIDTGKFTLPVYFFLDYRSEV